MYCRQKDWLVNLVEGGRGEGKRGREGKMVKLEAIQSSLIMISKGE